MPNTAGASVPPRSLSFYGVVTRIISSTVFDSSFVDIGVDLQGWTIYVVKQVLGTGLPPEGDGIQCTAYNTTSGRITLISAFGTALTVGDRIYAIHPYIGSNTVTTVFPSNNVKESSLAVAATGAIGYTKVKELTFTGIQGGARIKFDLKVDNAAGSASAVIYKNGVAVFNAIFGVIIDTDATGAYQSFSQDVYGLQAGDLVQIYALVNAAPRVASIRNFTIGYDTVTFPSVGLAIDMVYIDQVNGVAGTNWPLGTPGYPVNNMTDAKIIAAYRNTINFHVKNLLYLDQDCIQFNFNGDGDIAESIIFLQNHDLSFSVFNDLGVCGSSPGYIFANRCLMMGDVAVPGIYGIINGVLFECNLASIEPVPLSYGLQCTNCIAAGGGNTFSLSGGGSMAWTGGVGGVAIVQADNAASYFYLVAPGTTCSIDGTCTNGQIIIDATGRIDDSSAGSAVSDYSTYRVGVPKIFTKQITSAANAGDVVIATVTKPPFTVVGTLKSRVNINNVIVRSNGATTGDLTSAGVYGGAAKVLTLVSPLLATQANLAALDMQEQGVGPWALDTNGQVVISLVGTGATPVNLSVAIEYQPSNDGWLLK